jgi:stage V sporulation protein SpoVS
MMTSLSTCVMAGVIAAKGIAAIGSIGKTAKAQTAKPISIKRFIEATP